MRLIIIYYCETHRNLLFDVCQDKGVHINDRIMAVDFAAAMLSEANIEARASWTINRYLMAFFSQRINPSKNEIHRGGLSNDKFPPEVIAKQLEDRTKYSYSAKKLRLVLKVKLENEIKERDQPKSNI